MSAESTKRRAFVSLLKYAIVEEYYTSRKIFAVLKEYENDEVWDALFGILVDTEKHRILLDDIINSMNFGEVVDLGEKELYSFTAETFEDIDGIIEDLMTTEKYFYRMYSQILGYFESEIELILDTETAELVRKKFEEIIDDEIRHVDILTGLL